MTVTLTIIRYRRRYIAIALLAMAIHRIPLWLNKKISFWKLLGSGKNGHFDKTPDWQQWGILAVYPTDLETASLTNKEAELDLSLLYGTFIANWLRLFGCESWTIYLSPTEGHGSWDGKKVFGDLPLKTENTGPVAILTRASIRFSKLKSFWSRVDAVANQMAAAEGFWGSLGIGEVPWLKQATFSIWENRAAMKNFAYQMKEHRAVITDTKKEKWYTEDMFVRFTILGAKGTIKGKPAFEGKL